MARYLPKSIVCLREGYTRAILAGDLAAGLTVGVIALPLAIGFAIASGLEPQRGLFTAIVAGALISLLGGSRVQVGGPTGAFVAIVYGIVERHGYSGLAVATIMAGAIIIGMGLLRMGAMIKFIPYPVTTGFTAGIALIIFSQQIRDFFGLRLDKVPAGFVEKIGAFSATWDTWQLWPAVIGAGSLAIILLMRRFVPRVPGAIVAVIVSAAVVAAFGLPVETIGTRFGAIPRGLPTPALPPGFTLERVRELMPEAFTIAMLGAIESLLSAVVADGMTGYKHKSDCELVAQGVANIASVLFGGFCATGAIARTVANVKSGARTPLAGVIHALTLLVIMLAAAPYASRIPLCTLAAILMFVAWNMSEIRHFATILRSPPSDRLVLITTFGLTVLVDLTVAVGVGMVLASFLFLKRMADVTGVEVVGLDTGNGEDEPDIPDPTSIALRQVPPGVEVYQMNGPFFFGVADRLADTFARLGRVPKVFILRMRLVPAIDATGVRALEEVWHKMQRTGCRLLLSGVQPRVRAVLESARLVAAIGAENLCADIDAALARARAILAAEPTRTGTGIHRRPT